jgi:uncharacterized protein YdaU (DUF1376 family)
VSAFIGLVYLTVPLPVKGVDLPEFSPDRPAPMEVGVHFFKLHLGDYAQATAHLSFIEDAAYVRCLRKYYADEKPFPADIPTIQRLVGARSKQEKDAVERVVKEFFFLDGNLYRNKRADEEISQYESKSLKAKESAGARCDANA